MDITARLEGEVLVLELHEESLDASNVADFRAAVHSLIHDRSQVVLDLAGVRFIDSSGLGAMLSCLRQLNERKGDLFLCEMVSSVRVLFELMRIHRVFSIHETRADAVAAFG